MRGEWWLENYEKGIKLVEKKLSLYYPIISCKAQFYFNLIPAKRPVIANSRINDYDGENITFHYDRHEDCSCGSGYRQHIETSIYHSFDRIQRIKWLGPTT